MRIRLLLGTGFDEQFQLPEENAYHERNREPVENWGLQNPINLKYKVDLYQQDYQESHFHHMPLIRIKNYQHCESLNLEVDCQERLKCARLRCYQMYDEHFDLRESLHN